MSAAWSTRTRTAISPANSPSPATAFPDVVTEPDAWARAYHIAHDMLGGKLWMPQVAKATHYHAYWVHPDWVNEMKKIYKLGVHTFYRPRAWGDGSDEPTWGDAKATELEAAKEDKGIAREPQQRMAALRGRASFYAAKRPQIALPRFQPCAVQMAMITNIRLGRGMPALYMSPAYSQTPHRSGSLI